ncbi:Hsp20/alpha crystallin family protein [Limibacter armeniacum]|uniref:Hsp20/alpha crystallin family protein n=1 Tax=Limibacter armeniacum TaxID=466084 RepID=UPI002FE5F0B1
MRTKSYSNGFSPMFNLVNDVLSTASQAASKATQNQTIPVNVIEAEDSFKIEVVAPGQTKEQFKLELDENVLTVSSTVEETERSENEKVLRNEFVLRSFERAFKLPKNADGEQIAATYENGILSIHIPKMKEEKKKVEININ